MNHIHYHYKFQMKHFQFSNLTFGLNENLLLESCKIVVAQFNVGIETRSTYISKTNCIMWNIYLPTPVAQNFLLLNLIIPDFHKINYKFEHKHQQTLCHQFVFMSIWLRYVVAPAKENFMCEGINIPTCVVVYRTSKLNLKSKIPTMRLIIICIMYYAPYYI